MRSLILRLWAEAWCLAAGTTSLNRRNMGWPLWSGNHTENFRDIVSLFQSRDAVRIVGPAELPLVLLELLANDTERQALGQRAAETMRSQIGATARTADELQEIAGAAMNCRILCRRIYGGRWGRATRSTTEAGCARGELQGAVISVGNLSTGGSGKTPFVILLGELLKSARNPVRCAFARLWPQDSRSAVGRSRRIASGFWRRASADCRTIAGAGYRWGGSLSRPGALPKLDSANRFICWTMVFSTAGWLGISISFW